MKSNGSKGDEAERLFIPDELEGYVIGQLVSRERDIVTVRSPDGEVVVEVYYLFWIVHTIAGS